MFDLNLLEKLNNNQNNLIANFRKEKFETFNKLPIPKWKRLNINDLNIPEFKAYNKVFFNENEYVKNVTSILNEFENLKSYLYIDDFSGVGEKFVTLGETFYNTGIAVNIPKNTIIDEPVYIKYELDKENPLVIDHNIIVAEKNSSVTVIIDYLNTDEEITFHNGVTKVFAKENSVVNIIKIQRMNDRSSSLDSNIAFVDKYAKVNWISIELGSDVSASSYVTSLEEDDSESDLNSIYLGDKNRKLDLGYTMIHKGARSNSNILSKGALKNNSKKIFRGNLDFKKGSKKSVGVEEEYVLLLDPTVKSDAIPALLCEEDDVQGQHAASAGQIDDSKLFYIMSRGLSEKEAKKLIVEASFKPTIDKIPIENIRKEIYELVHRRIVNE